MACIMQLKELGVDLPSLASYLNDKLLKNIPRTWRDWWHELTWAVVTAKHKNYLCCTNAHRAGWHLLSGKKNSDEVGRQVIKSEKSRSLFMIFKAGWLSIDRPEEEDASQRGQIVRDLPRTPFSSQILEDPHHWKVKRTYMNAKDSDSNLFRDQRKKNH